MALIRYLTKIHFADGVLEDALEAEVEALGIARPLVVTDPGLVAAGLLDLARSALPRSATPTVFDATPSNPTEAAAKEARKLYRDEACDGLIGFGGGSSLDLAKAIGLLVSHERPLVDYVATEGGVARIRDELPPLIAVPTTAGTGSEVGGSAIISLDGGRKVGLLSPHLIPDVAICDPTLTLRLPPLLTAATGMDAVTHCIESYIATAYNPPADGIALDGLRRAASHIERAVEKGSDLAARREMMAAAMNGALALQKGLGGVHAMSHALGGLQGYQLHHGTLDAILLPHMLDFNGPAVGHRYGDLKQAMGVAPSERLPDAVAGLNDRLGLPDRLGDMGVDDQAIDRAAPLAERDHTSGTNPRRVNAGDYRDLMRAAL
ncbi:MAG: iron-containing alcohol dehydrogenase [Pseudomonadota bacterium]